MTTPAIKFHRKSELAYIWLRDRIISGELEEGSRLIIDDLAQQLGISQIPIREALAQLQAEGFVTFKPHIGATITEIYPSLALEIFGLLEVMETISGRIACSQATSAFLNGLETLLKEMDGLVDRPDHFSQENARFHQWICQQAGTHLIESMVTNVWLHWDRLRRKYLTSVFAHQTRQAQKEHWQLLDGLRARDPDRVEHVTREHNRRAKDAYQRYMENLSESPAARLHPTT